jgi:hypothetical protein
VSLDVTKRLNELSLAELLQLEAKLTPEQRLIDNTPDTASASDHCLTGLASSRISTHGFTRVRA